jgi:hypothetical protein
MAGGVRAGGRRCGPGTASLEGAGGGEAAAALQSSRSSLGSDRRRAARGRSPTRTLPTPTARAAALYRAPAPPWPARPANEEVRSISPSLVRWSAVTCFLARPDSLAHSAATHWQEPPVAGRLICPRSLQDCTQADCTADPPEEVTCAGGRWWLGELEALLQ